MHKVITNRCILRILTIITAGLTVVGCGSKCEPKTSAEIHQQALASCWQCDLFRIVYDGGSQLAAQVYQNAISGGSNLVALGFGIWLAMELMKHLSSIKFEDPAQFWKKVTHKFVICMLCTMAVSDADNIIWVVNTFITPVLVGFVEFADAVMTGGNNCGIVQATAANSDATISGALPGGPGDAMECLVLELHKKLVMGKALGRALFCDEDSKFDAALTGIFIILIFTIIDLVFPFYLMDCVMRLGIALALMPLMIMAYPFESTRSFSKKNFTLFLNTGMTMATMCISVTLMADALVNFVNDKYPFINDVDDADLSEFAGAGVGTVTLISLGFLSFSAVRTATSIASSLVGGHGMDGVIGTAVKAAGLILKVVGGGAMQALEKIQKMKEMAEKMQKATKGLAGGAKGGSKAGAKFGSKFGKVGQAVGGAVGGAAGAVKGAVQGAKSGGGDEGGE